MLRSAALPISGAVEPYQSYLRPLIVKEILFQHSKQVLYLPLADSI